MIVPVPTVSHCCIVAEEMVSAPHDQVRLTCGHVLCAPGASIRFLGPLRGYIAYVVLTAPTRLEPGSSVCET